MPTYQYACTACSHQLEVVQSFSDDPLTQCPACEGRLRKLFGSVGVVFKGPGFYRTDSRASANGNGAGASGKSASGKSASGNGADSNGTKAKESSDGGGATSPAKDAGKSSAASSTTNS